MISPEARSRVGAKVAAEVKARAIGGEGHGRGQLAETLDSNHPSQVDVHQDDVDVERPQPRQRGLGGAELSDTRARARVVNQQLTHGTCPAGPERGRAETRVANPEAALRIAGDGL